jgi:hypothetical protein
VAEGLVEVAGFVVGLVVGLVVSFVGLIRALGVIEGFEGPKDCAI